MSKYYECTETHTYNGTYYRKGYKVFSITAPNARFVEMEPEYDEGTRAKVSVTAEKDVNGRLHFGSTFSVNPEAEVKGDDFNDCPRVTHLVFSQDIRKAEDDWVAVIDASGALVVRQRDALGNWVEVHRFCKPSGTCVRKTADDSWETAQTGVEYYSPEQHGGYFGTIYRQYHGALIDGQAIPATGITKLISFAGQYNGGTCYNGNVGEEDEEYVISLYKGTNEIVAHIEDVSVISGWADYVK